MMRRVVACLALALLLLPAAQAASSGARAPIAADGTVSDVAIAATAGRFGAANNDAGSRFTGTPTQPVWNLWTLDGSLRAAGSADRTMCPAPAPPETESCTTSAIHIALNAAGTRIAVVARTPAGVDLLTTFSDGGVRGPTIELTNLDVTDLAMDASGSFVAVGLSVPNPPSPTTGKIQLYSYATLTRELDFATSAAVTDVDLETGLLVATAGGHYRFKAPDETPYVNSAISGSGAAVDASTHGSRWSVAGYSSGFFALFSDGAGDAQPSVPDYQKKEAGDTVGLTAVAIRNDATGFVTGNSAGLLRMYSLDPSTASPDTAVALTSTVANLGSIEDLVFSADGRYLAVRAGDTIRLFSTNGNVLSEMWSDTRIGAINTVAIDSRGEHVVAGLAGNVIVYDAIHRLVATPPSANQAPGTNATYTVTYRNDGNRHEAVTLSPTRPSGVGVDLTPSEFALAPGQSKAVQVKVALPSSQAPGTLVLALNHKMANGLDGSGTSNLTVTVPTVRKVVLEPDGATSLGANNGGPALFSVFVRNAGNVQETVKLQTANVPSGWTAAISNTSLTLAPGGVTTVTVSMQPPAGTGDGQSATFELRREAGVATPLVLTATVGANFIVTLRVPQGVILEAGAGKTVPVTIKNEGNALDSVNLKLNALPTGWLGSFLNGLPDIRIDDLKPGESRDVELSIRTPLDSESPVPKQVTLTVTSLGDPSKSQTKAILFTVEAPASNTTSSSSSDGKGGSSIPGPAPVLVLAALALAALAVRRRM